MAQWTNKENSVIELNAGSLTSSQISSLLVDRTAKAVRHQAEKLGVNLTGFIKHSKSNITLALELRAVGFTRIVIQEETGLSEYSQRYYEAVNLSLESSNVPY